LQFYIAVQVNNASGIKPLLIC